jgi:hypothetical protein
VNIHKDDYVAGPLEDWTRGALRFNGEDQYAVCPDEVLNQSFDFTINHRWLRGGRKETVHITGKDFKSPEVHETNFSVEVYFQTSGGITEGILAEKMSGAGYALVVNKKGGVTFTVAGGGKIKSVASKSRVNDGQWHHVLAEADREAGTLTIYIDGEEDARGHAVPKGVSLENSSDLFVGGKPGGKFFRGTMDFLRINLGTLADAKTDISELYARQFNGPFLRDFTGRKPNGKRDAGALEK